MTPLWIRIWHWAISVLFLILVITGVVLTYSWSDFVLMDYALADTLHQIVGVLFSLLVGVFLVVATITGYWRVYQRRWRGLWPRIRLHSGYVVSGGTMQTVPGAFTVSRVELSRGLLFLVQQFLYIGSMVVLSPMLVVTGVLLYFPELAPAEVAGLAGLWSIAQAHYWAGLIGVLFLLFHIYIATVAGLRRMIRGK